MNHTEKLRKNKDFTRLYRSGKKIASPYVILYVQKNRLGGNRLGLTAGKKIGNAVVRNRARRVMSAAYRLSEDVLPSGIDMVMVALPGITDAKSDAVRDFLLFTAKKRIERVLNAPDAPNKNRTHRSGKGRSGV